MRPAAAALLVAAVLPLAGASSARAAGTISWSRSGGIAGVSDRMTISPERKVVLRTRAGTERRTLPRSRHASIVRLVRAARLQTLKARYEPRFRVSDGFTTSLRHGGRTVTVLDGAEPPQRLERALAALSELAASLVR